VKAVAVAMRAATRRAIADFMVVFVKSEDEVVALFSGLTVSHQIYST
jgi:hypothetical protein